MGFSSGIATDQDDLLDKLRSFALAEGWTVNGWTADTSTYNTASTSGQRLHISKNGMFFNFRSSDGANVVDAEFLTNSWTSYWNDWVLWGIAVNGSTGYNAGSTWENQPGAFQIDGRSPASGTPTGVCSTIQGILSASVNYWLFSTSESLTMAVEYDPINYAGHMQFLHVGRIVPSGNILTTPGPDGMVYMASTPFTIYPNGTYTALQFYNELNRDSGNHTGFGSVRFADYGRGGVYLPSVPKNDGTTLTNQWFLVCDDSSDRAGNDVHVVSHAVPPNSWSEGMVSSLLRRTPNSETGITPLFPIYLTLNSQIGYSNPSYQQYHFVGVLDGVLNAAHTGFSLGGTSTIASDTYSHFPVWHTGQSSNSGLAIKQ